MFVDVRTDSTANEDGPEDHVTSTTHHTVLPTLEGSGEGALIERKVKNNFHAAPCSVIKGAVVLCDKHSPSREGRERGEILHTHYIYFGGGVGGRVPPYTPPLLGGEGGERRMFSLCITASDLCECHLLGKPVV